MAESLDQPACCGCGTPVPYEDRDRECPACYERGMRTIDAEFLDQYARLSVRSRRVVAESCLRTLVLADPLDRKLLGLTIYEQFTGAARDFIGLFSALQSRRSVSITQRVLDFRLDVQNTFAFFQQLAALGPTELLALLGLPHPDQVGAGARGLDKRERSQVRAALNEALGDFDRLVAMREIGERALVAASRQLAGNKAIVDPSTRLRLPALEGDRVAALAIDAGSRRLIVNYLDMDEETLQSVVDGIDVLTRLSTNVIFAFVSLHGPDQFRAGFA